MGSRFSSFMAELKRRKVHRVAAVYVTVGAGIVGLGDAAFPSAVWEHIQVPVVVLVFAGLPVALLLSWFFEVRPEEKPKPDSVPIPVEFPPKRGKSIVVLPFDNISPDPGDSYFSDGLTEEVISHLSCCGPLQVISRNSAMALKGTRKDTRTIGDELGVECVLEGSVRKDGDNLRISAQLIDTATDTNLWTETYEGTLQDLFDFQENVARSIVEALNVQMSSDEEERMSERPIEDVHAYDSYLRARQEIWRWTADALDRATLHLNNGLRIIGNNPLLLFGLGYVQFQYVNAGHKLGEDAEAALKKAEGYAEEIFQIQPDSAHAHCLLGLVAYKRGHPAEVIHHLKAALAKDAGDRDALWFLAIVYARSGKVDAARPLVQRLVRTDPLAPLSHSMEGYLHLMAGEFSEALPPYQRAFEMDPEDSFLRLLLAEAHLMNDEFDVAKELVQPLVSRDPAHIIEWVGSLFGAAFAEDGREVGRLARLEFSEGAMADPAYAHFVAQAHALVGDEENALFWLGKAIDGGMVNYPYFSKGDPAFRNLQVRPGFVAMVEQIRGEWEKCDA